MNQKTEKFYRKFWSKVLSFWNLHLKVFGHLDLPRKNHKGNLLRTLLDYFLSLSDLIAGYGRGISWGALVNWKYYSPCRQAFRRLLLYAGFALFFLSFLEGIDPSRDELPSCPDLEICQLTLDPGRQVTLDIRRGHLPTLTPFISEFPGLPNNRTTSRPVQAVLLFRRLRRLRI